MVRRLPPFVMKNGTRQGCALSPLLFVLTLEPLLASIRNNLDIKGIEKGEEEHKLAAYADDVLFYISNPRITIPNLLRILKQYGEISNFKINLGKSEILNINISRQEEVKLQTEFHFPWRKDIKYLGKNSTRPLSWIGRINMVKMVMVPKIYTSSKCCL